MKTLTGRCGFPAINGPTPTQTRRPDVFERRSMAHLWPDRWHPDELRHRLFSWFGRPAIRIDAARLGAAAGETMGPPVNPGYEAEDCVLQMAEAGDGTLFAQGERQLLVLKGGRWQPQAGNLTRLVCATHDGGVVAMEYSGSQGRLWFSLWDGNQFVRASAPVSCQSNARSYHLREAPDGSLWCVGYGTVVRWAYRAGRWTVYPNCRRPWARMRRSHLVRRRIQRGGVREQPISNPSSGKTPGLEPLRPGHDLGCRPNRLAVTDSRYPEPSRRRKPVASRLTTSGKPGKTAFGFADRTAAATEWSRIIIRGKPRS